MPFLPCHLNFLSDEAHLLGTALDPHKFAYHHRIGVDDTAIYLLHRTITNLENIGRTDRVMFFDTNRNIGGSLTTLLTGVNATVCI